MILYRIVMTLFYIRLFTNHDYISISLPHIAKVKDHKIEAIIFKADV